MTVLFNKVRGQLKPPDVMKARLSNCAKTAQGMLLSILSTNEFVLSLMHGYTVDTLRILRCRYKLQIHEAQLQDGEAH